LALALAARQPQRGGYGGRCGSGDGPADGPDGERLLQLAGDFAAVAVPGRAVGRISLDTPISTGIGLDSLAVVELRSRVEQAFDVVMPGEVLAAGTLRDWLAVIRAAQQGAGPVPEATARPPRAAAGLPELATAAAGPAGDVPAGAKTLPGALAWHADAHPATLCIHDLGLGGGPPGGQEITYGELDNWSRAVARGLRAAGLAQGDRVAIMLPTCTAFFSAFMGTLLAGGVAVPVYPPSSRTGLEEHALAQRVLAARGARGELAAAGSTGPDDPERREQVPFGVPDAPAGSAASGRCGS